MDKRVIGLGKRYITQSTFIHPRLHSFSIYKPSLYSFCSQHMKEEEKMCFLFSLFISPSFFTNFHMQIVEFDPSHFIYKGYVLEFKKLKKKCHVLSPKINLGKLKLSLKESNCCCSNVYGQYNGRNKINFARLKNGLENFEHITKEWRHTSYKLSLGLKWDLGKSFVVNKCMHVGFGKICFVSSNEYVFILICFSCMFLGNIVVGVC